MLKQAGAMHKAAEIQGGFATRFARALAIRILLPGALAADWLSETERPTILPLHLPGALKHRAVRGGLWAIPRSLCALILFGLSPVLSIAATGCAAQRAESKLTQRDSTFGSAPLRVSSPEAPSSETPTEGQEVLRDATAMEPGIADEVRKNGTPDAVEVHSRELAANEPAGRKEFFIALYYKRPSQTLLYRERRETLFLYTFDQVLNISEVPRSVRRQAFREGPMPPPWPVTISRTATFPEILGGLPLPQAVNIADAFGAPMCPAAATPPSVGEDSTAYAAISDGIRKGIAQIHRGASFDRGSRAFARIDPAARLSGFNWTLVVFHSPANYAFTVPDGSIFLSDGLIEQLSDDQVVAVITCTQSDFSYTTDIHTSHRNLRPSSDQGMGEGSHHARRRCGPSDDSTYGTRRLPGTGRCRCAWPLRRA